VSSEGKGSLGPTGYNPNQRWRAFNEWFDGNGLSGPVGAHRAAFNTGWERAVELASAEIAQLKARLALMPNERIASLEEDNTDLVREVREGLDAKAMLEAEVARRRADETALAKALEEARSEQKLALNAATLWEGLCKSSSALVKKQAEELKDARTAVRVLSGLVSP